MKKRKFNPPGDHDQDCLIERYGYIPLQNGLSLNFQLNMLIAFTFLLFCGFVDLFVRVYLVFLPSVLVVVVL
jgi:hypothetical protein